MRIRWIVLGTAWCAIQAGASNAADFTMVACTRQITSDYYDNFDPSRSWAHTFRDETVLGATTLHGYFGGVNSTATTNDFISVGFHSTMSTYHPYPSPFYVQESDYPSTVATFDVTGTGGSAVADCGLVSMSLSRISPDPRSWQIPVNQITTLTGLDPGRYLVRFDSFPDLTGSATLYLPSPGATATLALCGGLLAARRRR